MSGRCVPHVMDRGPDKSLDTARMPTKSNLIGSIHSESVDTHDMPVTHSLKEKLEQFPAPETSRLQFIVHCSPLEKYLYTPRDTMRAPNRSSALSTNGCGRSPLRIPSSSIRTKATKRRERTTISDAKMAPLVDCVAGIGDGFRILWITIRRLIEPAHVSARGHRSVIRSTVKSVTAVLLL